MSTQTVLASRLSPLSSAAWHKALSSPERRDKLFRLVQYLLKLLHAMDHGSSGSPGATHGLEAAIGSARQLSRLFKSLSVYATASTAARAPRTGGELATAVHEGGLFGYYALDNAALAAKLGLVPAWRARAPRLARLAGACWLVGVLGALGVESTRVRALRDEERRGREENDKSQRQAALMTRRRAAQLKIGWLLADVVVAWSVATGGSVPAKVVGAAGTVGSAIAIYLGWPRAV